MATRDLNLLHALDALLMEGSVTRAAARARMTAPAMSRALARLRDAVGDPLLVRAGREMVLTPFAVSIREAVHGAHVQATSLLGPAEHASLDTAARTVVVRCSDAVAAVFAAPLHARARRDVPRVRVHFASEGDEDPAALREGLVDLDLGALDADAPEIRVRLLFRDAFVALVRRDHPLSHPRSRTSPRWLTEHPHVVVSRTGKARGPLDAALERKGLRREVAAVVPSFLAAALACAGSDLVSTVPGTLASHLTRVLPVIALDIPLPLPALSIGMAWHPRAERDPIHQWLRRQVEELARHAVANSSA